MIRLISTRRLQQLELSLASTRSELGAERQRALAAAMQLRLTEQARDFYKLEADKWERRASRFIDQIGVKSATLDSPVMGDPAAPPPSEVRQVMTALSTHALRRTIDRDAAPAVPRILGVDETAAAEAVAGVLER